MKLPIYKPWKPIKNHESEHFLLQTLFVSNAGSQLTFVGQSDHFSLQTPFVTDAGSQLTFVGQSDHFL